jgi:hypothetical protein
MLKIIIIFSKKRCQFEEGRNPEKYLAISCLWGYKMDRRFGRDPGSASGMTNLRDFKQV